VLDTRVLYNESTDHTEEQFQIIEADSYYLLPLEAVEEFLNQFPDSSAEIFRYIDNNGG
jgi:hypothetical protein